MKKPFINKLQLSGMLNDNWDIINDSSGSSSSTLIRIERRELTEFLKGNELPIYNSLENEISAQKQLTEKYPEEKWYLAMSSVDPECEWIAYPYLKCQTLADYLKNKELSSEETDLLGSFLCEVVTKLKRVNIVHNDFREGNIVVTEEPEGGIHFWLIDFGCASVLGKIPWECTFWGRYMFNGTCGNNRYSSYIIDDAVAAYLIYLRCGGKEDDEYAEKLKSLFGNVYFSVPHSWYGDY